MNHANDRAASIVVNNEPLPQRKHPPLEDGWISILVAMPGVNQVCELWCGRHGSVLKGRLGSFDPAKGFESDPGVAGRAFSFCNGPEFNFHVHAVSYWRPITEHSDHQRK